jgi:hypothetical protein
VNAALSIPLRLVSEPSREQLVVSAIQQHFPDFNLLDFTKWMEKSFFPFFLTQAIACRPSGLVEVADAGVIKDRELYIATVVQGGAIVHSKFLSVYDVEVMDYEFKGTFPVVSVKGVADHTEDIRTDNGKQISGGPECIYATEFLLAMTVMVVGDEPVWKAIEFHQGSVCKRI